LECGFEKKNVSMF